MRIGSTFDILGPIMVGPSSSHTAGALRIAQLAASLCHDEIASVDFTLYNSFAQTYRGHGTDRALVGGLLGMHTDDPRIRNSFALARERSISWTFTLAPDGTGLHPNTVDIAITCRDGKRTSVRGESVGGGRIHISRINGVDVDVTGRMPTLVVEHRDVPGMLALMTTALGSAGVNIAYMSSYRTEPGQTAYAVFETDTPVPTAAVATIAAQPNVMDAYEVSIPGSAEVPAELQTPYDFVSGSTLLALCEEHQAGIGDIMRRREVALCGETATAATMDRTIQTMRDEVHAPLDHPQSSLGGLIGGEAKAFNATRGTNLSICGDALSAAVAYAMATLERSAAMGVIVAAPTAGSSGVVPGCLIALQEARGFDDETLANALYTAAAVGAIIEHSASVSGAEGGCQAEVGTASAMAAAAITFLLGGSPRESLTAASIAIANLLGLVCDPVRGLVEIPCQVRNAIGAANAFTAAQMARGPMAFAIPFDEVVSAMDEVGRALPASLRETAQGGLAACASCTGGCLGSQINLNPNPNLDPCA